MTSTPDSSDHNQDVHVKTTAQSIQPLSLNSSLLEEVASRPDRAPSRKHSRSPSPSETASSSDLSDLSLPAFDELEKSVAVSDIAPQKSDFVTVSRGSRSAKSDMPLRRSTRLNKLRETDASKKVVETPDPHVSSPLGEGAASIPGAKNSKRKSQIIILRIQPKLLKAILYSTIASHQENSSVALHSSQNGTIRVQKSDEPSKIEKVKRARSPDKDTPSAIGQQLLTTPVSQPLRKKPRSAATEPLTQNTLDDQVASPPLTPDNTSEDSRPLCIGQPEVWATDRPALCETVKYFNSWQGAASTLNGFASGMLLDEDAGGKGYMDEDIVITRAGGCMSTNGQGESIQIKDHDPESATIKAFYNNMFAGIPLHLIVGQKNKNCPTKIPHRYCVMAPFAVVDIWCEKLHGKKAIVYRMQKLDLISKSWWAPNTTTPSVKAPNFTLKAERKTCDKCGKESPQRFAEGWMCANEACKMFWKIRGKVAAENLSYNVAWLAERTHYSGFDPSYKTKADLLSADSRKEATFAVSEACTKGIVCRRCGACIPRRQWDAWKCQTDGCGFIYKVLGQPVSAAAVAGDSCRKFDGPAMSEDKILDSTINCHIEQHGLFRVSKYNIAPECFVVHLHSNDTINSAPGGPDDLFWDLQNADIGLKRNLMKQAVVEGQMTKHFTTNFGLPYKFVVNVDSKGFSEAPHEILESVRRMTWAGKYFVTDGSFLDFNELLAVGYLEKCKMGYHDDGEDTLGPTVASFSLGSPASFTFRMKKKFFSGFAGKDFKKYDPTLPILDGCHKPEERRRLNSLAATMSRDELSALAYDSLVKGVKTLRSCAPVILDLTVKHGDIIVMHGAGIQKYFEANPAGKLRFALTCRYVKPEMIETDQHWKGQLPVNFNDPSKAYDGDIALYDAYRRGLTNE